MAKKTAAKKTAKAFAAPAPKKLTKKEIKEAAAATAAAEASAAAKPKKKAAIVFLDAENAAAAAEKITDHDWAEGMSHEESTTHSKAIHRSA